MWEVFGMAMSGDTMGVCQMLDLRQLFGTIVSGDTMGLCQNLELFGMVDLVSCRMPLHKPTTQFDD